MPRITELPLDPTAKLQETLGLEERENTQRNLARETLSATISKT